MNEATGGDDWRASALKLALSHARTADGLLVVAPGRCRVSVGPPQAPTGVAGLLAAGRTAFICGGPLAASADVGALVAAVDRDCRSRRLDPLWLNVTAAELSTLAAAGFGATRTGAECVVEHPGSWRGTPFRSVRAGCHRAARGGVRVSEAVDHVGAFGPAGGCATALIRVYRRHLAAKPQRRPADGFTAPPLIAPPDAGRVWAARVSGREIGYATAHPLGVWGERGRRWTLGAFHTDPDAPSGTAALLVRSALDALAADGICEVSLGPAPALKVGPRPEGENPVVSFGVRAWPRFGNGLFDARGLWHFKSRFRPTLEPLYACGRPRVTARQAADFVRVSGVLRVDPRRALRGTWADLRRPATFGAAP